MLTYGPAWQVRLAHFPLQVAFTRPRRTAAISLTGEACALNCAHCGKRYLRGMTPLAEVDRSATVGRATSCLISGGCDAGGRVPVTAQLEQIAQLRQGRRLNWHVGWIGEDEARQIAPWVDVISLDLVGDRETIREVYGLPYTAAEGVALYQMLRRSLRVVPHITIGLRGGVISGEYEALHALREAGADAVVFLVLIPTKGTAYEDCTPPAPETVGELLAAARELLPGTPLSLGCMRPAGRYRDEVDQIALQAGVNQIVNPAPAAVTLAGELGLRVLWWDECCVFTPEMSGA